MMRAIAAAMLAAGCMSVPPYQPEVSVSYTEAGTGGTVAGPGFALRFAGGDGFHFPDALLIDGVDVMGHESAPACFDEDGVGFRITPTPRISATGEAEPLRNRLVPVLRGPAVVQVALEWRTRFTCDATRAPGGISRFTVFPDGRIVRHDTLDDPGTAALAPSQCQCANTDALFTVSTYWTFARDAFDGLYARDLGGLPAPDGPVITNREVSCVESSANARQLALAWPDASGTTIRSSDAVLGFGRELVFGDPTLEVFGWRTNSAVFIERAGCQAALARADEHAAPSPLAINQVAARPSLLDGIYGGDDGDDGNGPPGIELAEPRAELTGPTGSSFAVWLRFPRPVDALRARRDGATRLPYLPQRIDDRAWIVWFADPIPAGQTIVIEPM